MTRLLCLFLAAIAAACAWTPHALAQRPASVRGEIPFSYIDHIFLDVRLSDSLTAVLVYDPVRNIMLDERYARTHGIRTYGGEEVGYGAPVRVGGAGGVQHVVTFARRLTLRADERDGQPVLEQTFPLTPTIPLDSMMAVALGRTVDGLFGINLLDDYVVEFDFDGERFVLHDTASFVPPPATSAIPVTPIGRAGKPSVPVTVVLADGSAATGQFVLDFGMGGAVRLTTGFTEQHDLAARVPETFTSGAETGLGGALQSLIGRVPAIRVGAVAVEQPIISMAQETEGADAYPAHDGLLGLGLLDRYRVYYDASGRRLWLAPTSRTTEPFVYAETGVQWEPVGRRSGGLVVRAIAEGSPADEAGLLAGDRLLAAGDADAAAWTKREWRAAIDAASVSSRPLALRIARGGAVLDLTLRAETLL